MRLEAIATPARHSTADYPQQNKLAEVHNIIIIFDIFFVSLMLLGFRQ